MLVPSPVRILVIASLLLSPLATAGWGDLAVAYEGSGEGPFWSAQRFSSAFTPVDIDVRTTSPSDSLRYGIAVLAENGTVIYGEVGDFMFPCEARIMVRAAPFDDLTAAQLWVPCGFTVRCAPEVQTLRMIHLVRDGTRNL